MRSKLALSRIALLIAFLTSGLAQTGSARININTALFNKCIAFIYRADTSGQNANSEDPVGTGFFVQVPLTSDPQRVYTLFVTARHIVDPEWAGCPVQNPTRYFLRLNTKSYDPARDSTGVGYVKLDLVKDGMTLWKHHPSEENADVAVLELMPSDVEQYKTYDIAAIPLSDFSANDELNARNITDPVVSAGLLPGVSGVKRNYPIVKLGYISNKPDELVSGKCIRNAPERLYRLWLLSINLVSGNSGSPIFYIPEGSNGVSFGGGRPSLLGLQSISYPGSDVAGMTPANYIFETVESLGLNGADLYRGLPKTPVVAPKN